MFAFPPVQPQAQPPVIGTVDLAVTVTPGEAAGRVLQRLAHAESGRRWLASAERPLFLSPHQGFHPDQYPDPVLRRQAEILNAASVFRQDASQQMPTVVGEQAFRVEMLDWVMGRDDLRTALQSVDRLRPAPPP